MHKPLEISQKIELFDTERLEKGLNDKGFVRTGPLLAAADCEQLKRAFEEQTLYRKHIHMARHGYGQGEYKYFQYPLPALVSELRQALYEKLVPLANSWMQKLDKPVRYPDTLDAFTKRCHDAGQQRPTPLILRYRQGDYNRLHQDLYGEHVFPLQAAIVLSEPGWEFSGGEFVMTEARARMQSRPHVVNLQMGEAIIFAVNERPIVSKRGFARVQMRHGVSELTGGERFTLGIIFHDAA